MFAQKNTQRKIHVSVKFICFQILFDHSREFFISGGIGIQELINMTVCQFHREHKKLLEIFFFFNSQAAKNCYIAHYRGFM